MLDPIGGNLLKMVLEYKMAAYIYMPRKGMRIQPISL